MDETEETTTELTTLDAVSVKALMANLAHEFRVLPDVDTEDGFEENRVGLRKLVRLRNATDKLRLRLNKPHRDAIKATDDEAKKVIAFVADLEKAKKEADDRIQREIDIRAEEEASREARRVEAIEHRVGEIRNMVNVPQDLKSLQVRMAQLEAIDIEDGSFDEFEEAAQAAYNYAHVILAGHEKEATQRAEEAKKNAEKAAELAEQKAEMDKQMEEIEAAKQKLADEQHEMDVQKQLAEDAKAQIAADLAAEVSRKEEAKKAALAAAQKKADDEKAERDARVAAAIEAEKMRQDSIKYKDDADDLLALSDSLNSLKDAIATTNCNTPEAQAIRITVAHTIGEIQTFILGSDVVKSQAEESEAA